jgi:transposase
MGLEQQVPLWKPLSKNLYGLRLLTRQHQRLQELKTQSTNQQHALAHSAFDSSFIDKQLANLIAVYDTQLAAMEKAIEELIEADPILKPKVDALVKVKGLALLSVAVLVDETNGFDRVDFYGLCKGWSIKFVIFFSSLHHCIHAMNQPLGGPIVSNSIDH